MHHPSYRPYTRLVEAWTDGSTAPSPSALRARRLEHVTLPGRHIEVESARLQIAAVAIVLRSADEIPQAPIFPDEIGERQPDIALAVMVCIVDADDQAIPACAPPGIGNHILAGSVALPSGRAIQQPPFRLTDERPPQHVEQPFVETLDLGIHPLVRAADEVWRD